MAKAEVLRDPTYYFEVVIFKVEDTLFRVPKCKFELPGTPFEAMFALPTGPNAKPEGVTDAAPISLPHPVSKRAFRAFLRILYPFEPPSFSYEDWTGILELSSMWQFDAIRTRAISALTPMLQDRTVAQILLGKKFDILDWVKQGYTRLIRQESPPFMETLLAEGLSPINIAKVFAAREQIHMKHIRKHKQVSEATIIGLYTMPNVADSATICKFCGQTVSAFASGVATGATLSVANNANNNTNAPGPGTSLFAPAPTAPTTTTSTLAGAFGAPTTFAPNPFAYSVASPNNLNPHAPISRPILLSSVPLPIACFRTACQDKRKAADAHLRRIVPGYTTVADESTQIIATIFASEFK